MPALSTEGLRQAIAARIAGVSGWWEAPVPYGSFGLSGVTNSVPETKAHLAFVVGTPTSPKFDWRQKTSEGVWTETVVGVRFLARFTPGPTKAQASVDAATAAEQAIIKRLLIVDATWPATFFLQLDSIPRHAAPIPSGDWLLSEIQLIARHIYALA